MPESSLLWDSAQRPIDLDCLGWIHWGGGAGWSRLCALRPSDVPESSLHPRLDTWGGGGWSVPFELCGPRPVRRQGTSTSTGWTSAPWTLTRGHPNPGGKPAQQRMEPTVFPPLLGVGAPNSAKSLFVDPTRSGVRKASPCHRSPPFRHQHHPPDPHHLHRCAGTSISRLADEYLGIRLKLSYG